MLTSLTAAQLDHGLAAIALAQHMGELPPGPVSRRTLAAYSGLAPSTIEKIESIALARAYQNATALGIQSPCKSTTSPSISAPRKTSTAPSPTSRAVET